MIPPPSPVSSAERRRPAARTPLGQAIPMKAMARPSSCWPGPLSSALPLSCQAQRSRSSDSGAWARNNAACSRITGERTMKSTVRAPMMPDIDQQNGQWPRHMPPLQGIDRRLDDRREDERQQNQHQDELDLDQQIADDQDEQQRKRRQSLGRRSLTAAVAMAARSVRRRRRPRGGASLGVRCFAGVVAHVATSFARGAARPRIARRRPAWCQKTSCRARGQRHLPESGIEGIDPDAAAVAGVRLFQTVGKE